MPATQDNASRLIAGLRTNAINSLIQQFNVNDPVKFGRSNAHAFGLGGLADGALAATGVLAAVPIPVQPGDEFAKVLLPIGATAAGTPTNSFAALYSGIGVPALLGQSKDGTSAAIAKEKLFTFSLEAPVLITAANAPNGFIYAGVSITATTVPTAATSATPAAINYPWGTNAPLFFSLTAGSALAGTAAATIASPAAKAVAPILILV